MVRTRRVVLTRLPSSLKRKEIMVLVPSLFVVMVCGGSEEESSNSSSSAQSERLLTVLVWKTPCENMGRKSEMKLTLLL